MECNCNNNNSNGGVIPWVRGNRLPLIICVYENVVTQEQVGDSTLTVNEMTRVPYTIQDNDTVTVIMKSGFRQVEMPFTTDGNKVMVTDNGELPTGAYTVEVTIERGDGARGRWQETRQVRIYENTSDAQLGEMYSIDADLFFYAKGDTGTGIADITNNPDGTLTITMTDGTSYVTEALKGDKGDKGDTGERGVSIVSFDVTGQTDVSVIYTVTFSDDTTQDISVPKGPQGDTGLTGNGISTTTLNSDYTLTISYTDGTTYTTPSIRGAQGAQGVSVIGFTQTGETATNTMYNLVFSDGRTQSVAIPKGTKGDKGDPGNPGPQGAQGPKGDTVTATDYTLYNVQGSDSQGAMSQDATTKAISAQTGYYTCGTVEGTAEKVVTVDNGSLYKRTLGGHFKVKMTNKNTAASGVTLQIGSETAAALWYNGAAVSADNSWDAGEVLSVYYDGSVYQASNAQGCSNKKIDAYLYGDLRTLAVGQTYEKDTAIKTADKQLRRITKEIKALSLSETLASGDIRVSSPNTYRVASAVNTYDSSATYSAGAYALGSMTVYTLTVTADSVAVGNITVNGTEVAIEATDDAVAIATKISSALNIDGWTDSASGNVVTVRCNTIGNNTTTITIGVGDTGVVVSGNSTPSETGTSIIRKYDGESWADATPSGMIEDGILVEVDVAWLLTNATDQNSVAKDIEGATKFVETKNIDLSTISQVAFSLWGNAWHSNQSNIFVKKVEVSPGEIYDITPDTTYSTEMFFMATYNPQNNVSVDCIRMVITKGTAEEITVPEGMNYMVFQDDHVRTDGVSANWKIPNNVSLIAKTTLKDAVTNLHHKFDYSQKGIVPADSIKVPGKYFNNTLQWAAQNGDTYLYSLDGYSGYSLTITRGQQRPSVYFIKDSDTTIGHSSACNPPYDHNIFPTDVKTLNIQIPLDAKFLCVLAGWQSGDTSYFPQSIVINKDKFSPIIREEDGRTVTRQWEISNNDNPGLLSASSNEIVVTPSTSVYRTTDYIKIAPKGNIVFTNCYFNGYGYCGVHLYNAGKEKLMQYYENGTINLEDFPTVAYIRFSSRAEIGNIDFSKCSIKWTYTSLLSEEDIDEVTLSSVYVELTQSMALDNSLQAGYNYFVGSPIDLDGNSLNIPECTIKFGTYGKITNGNIVFSNTKIDSTVPCFIDDELSGTLEKQDINAFWFYKNDIGTAVTQATKLLEGEGRVYITQGVYSLFTPMLVKSYEILDLNGSTINVYAYDCPCIDSLAYEGNDNGYSAIKICNAIFISQTSSERTYYHIDIVNSSQTTYENIRIKPKVTDGVKDGIRLGRKTTGFTGATFVQRVVMCTCQSIYAEDGCTDSYINKCELWCDPNYTAAEACITVNSGSWSISDNQLVGGSKGAIVIGNGEHENIRITNNYFDGSYSRIDTHDAITGSIISGVIANNSFWHMNGCGIKATLKGTVINSNVFDCNDKDNTGESDLVILGGGGNTIIGNTFRRTATTAVPAMRLTDSGLKTTVIGNTIFTPTRYIANVYNNTSRFIIANNNEPTLFGE